MTAVKKTPTKKKTATPAKKAAGTSPVARIQKVGGEDFVIAALSDGETMTAIADKTGVTVGQLSVWLSQDDERSARAREARTLAARIWDEEAEQVVKAAGDVFELSRAKELAHHYRWRASKIAPKEYGDKLLNEHTGANGGAIKVASTVTFVRPTARPEDDE